MLKVRPTETGILKRDIRDEERFEFHKQKNPDCPDWQTGARKGAAMKKLLYVSGAVFVGSILGLACALAIEAARTRFSRLF